MDKAVLSKMIDLLHGQESFGDEIANIWTGEVCALGFLAEHCGMNMLAVSTMGSDTYSDMLYPTLRECWNLPDDVFNCIYETNDMYTDEFHRPKAIAAVLRDEFLD